MGSEQKNNKTLFVFGSIVQDLVSYVDRFPNPGESVRGKLFKTFYGGKGANQAVMAARLNANVVFAGRVGNDMFGEANIHAIQHAGCDVSLIDKSDTAATGSAVVTVSSDGENNIVVTLGSNLELTAQRAQELEPEIAKASMLLIQSEIEQDANLEAAEFITEEKITTLEGFKEAAKKILQLGPRIAIVTLGPNGAIIAQRNQETNEVTVDTVPAPKVTAVDTTGAGDCFCGSLAYLLLAHPDESVVDHVAKAVKIAAISVQRKGPQSSYPTKEELMELNLYHF